MKWAALLLWGALALGGCARDEVILRGGGGAALEVEHPGGRVLLLRAGEGLRLAPGRPFVAAPGRLEADYAEALAALPPAPERFVLYLNGTERIAPRSRTDWERLLATLHARAPAVVLVVGHTDRQGEAGLNEAVGLKRARAVAALLQAEGIEVLRLQVASHGEANPLVQTPDERAEVRNRRVEVSVQ